MIKSRQLKVSISYTNRSDILLNAKLVLVEILDTEFPVTLKSNWESKL